MCQVFVSADPQLWAHKARSIRLHGVATSIRLENAFWNILDRIADADGVSTPAFISKLHSEVLQTQGEPVNFTSLLRTACLIFEAQNDPQTHHDDVLPVAAE